MRKTIKKPTIKKPLFLGALIASLAGFAGAQVGNDLRDFDVTPPNSEASEYQPAPELRDDLEFDAADDAFYDRFQYHWEHRHAIPGSDTYGDIDMDWRGWDDASRAWRITDQQWRQTDRFWRDENRRDTEAHEAYWKDSDAYWEDSDHYWDNRASNWADDASDQQEDGEGMNGWEEHGPETGLNDSGAARIDVDEDDVPRDDAGVDDDVRDDDVRDDAYLKEQGLKDHDEANIQ